MNSPIPPFGQKPHQPPFSKEEIPLIRKWLVERIAIQNLVDRINILPTRTVGWNGERATIQ